MDRLVLSLFPGVGLLDAQFEAEGFCVVRGPDPVWGGDIRRFAPPGRVFQGIIGGPPCQDFSSARRTAPTGEGVELLAEFARVVDAAGPDWWLCENVPRVPDVVAAGYLVQRLDIDQAWYSGVSRLRHVQFGRRDGASIGPLEIPRGDRCKDPEPGAMASDGRSFSDLCRLQGLPDGFNLPGFTDKGRKRAVGNGVPCVLGRVLAQAVRRVVHNEGPGGAELPTYDTGRRRCSECERVIGPQAVTCSQRCRKVRSRKACAASVLAYRSGVRGQEVGGSQ